MKSVYRTKDKMREDFLQNEQDAMMKESFDTRKISLNISKGTKSLIIAIVIIVIVIIATGGINIPNKNLYDIEFDLSITGFDIRSTVHTEYKKTYIPFILYSTADEFASYNYKTIEKGHDYNVIPIGPYILKVTAYRCHYINDEINVPAGCGGQSTDAVLTDDPRTLTKVKSNIVKYTGLKIIDRGNNSEVVYDGELVQDLSKYLTKPSTYAIFIYAEYDSAKAMISTTIEIGDENE